MPITLVVSTPNSPTYAGTYTMNSATGLTVQQLLEQLANLDDNPLAGFALEYNAGGSTPTYFVCMMNGLWQTAGEGWDTTLNGYVPATFNEFVKDGDQVVCSCAA